MSSDKSCVVIRQVEQEIRQITYTDQVTVDHSLIVLVSALPSIPRWSLYSPRSAVTPQQGPSTFSLSQGAEAVGRSFY